ncbi:protein-glutamate methylesterase/protein-glutamine glutaminase [Pseudoalteromonas phenolica]|uniref:Protein-glutamate methylesterase/protein-glutamine glutaminase n=1 Tax=Pseudoalteromonas phenolica TaxID=161398 RepID=A0A0S2K661_9GAMM|nr:chemotaxis response regulator protein-glutamate methylesterase [Pseudoalteromonas phenolica]ALO43519.1 Chemotaxis response regulator protein-glutamate methylesterase [Pseudoalteromonas phenolica]MBE0355320.1 two-component system, chemotaxis family, response regulator CheB [Pseudoalteromonas phenolica O-BC30]RXF05114.1 chemotaxis response regulator protein-glutamate methylesterase [Pseudoalteromonas phenolica O-BC30]
MIKVLIVDDSPLIRGILTEVIQQAKDLTVVGSAEDPYQAREMIKSLNPDVITLDIEMPKMDGISFLRNLMRLRPMPVVMISTLTQQGSPITLEALEIGAVDFIAKPKVNVAEQLQHYAESVQEKVRTAATARLRPYRTSEAAAQKAQLPSGQAFERNSIIAIGASTGGTEAIKEVLVQMPKDAPPIVITQHIPPVFSSSFAMRMDKTCAMHVKEAEDGDILEFGRVYIAPGDKHLKVVSKGLNKVCVLDDGELVNRHKPAVDVLFDSLKPFAKSVTAVLLTGMGSDGARGMLGLLEAGAKTAAQDEQTSVVWGMPKAAVEMNAAQKVLPLQSVAAHLIKSTSR